MKRLWRPAVVENITESSSRQVGAEVDTQKETEMRLSVVDLQDKLPCIVLD